jgi:chromosomal replication initiation ATPase DnaA
MAEQLPLDLPHEPALEASDFLESACNELAVQKIEHWPDWPQPLVALIGPKGSGKSHLARIWARHAEASIISASEIGSLFPQDVKPIVVLEDADRKPPDEAALFHLINRVRLERGSLVFTARRPPSEWTIRTPDLASRLRLVDVVSIDPPDDAFLRALLVKLFLDRQMSLSASVVEYLLPRMERSFAAAQALVKEMDRLSLAKGVRPGRSMASEVLQRMGRS